MSVPYAMQMDPDKARELVQRGATLLLLNVPAGTAVGVDHQMFLSGPKFCGVKMLPPGPHMLTYYAVASSPGGFSAPNVRWVFLGASEVGVLRWNADVELLEELGEQEEAERYVQGVRRFDFDAGLAPYNLPAWSTWREIAGNVTKGIIERIMPACGTVSVVAEAQLSEDTAAEAQLTEQLRARSAGNGGDSSLGSNPMVSAATMERLGRCCYTPMPIKVARPGMTPAEITAANLDRSGALDRLINEKYGGDGGALLGEFQMAFANFVVGHSLAGYAQWKDILVLLCTSTQAWSGSLAGTVASFARILRKQLQVSLAPGSGEAQVSGGEGLSDATPFGVPMVEELLSTSFFRPLLGDWFEDLDGCAAAPDGLRSEAKKLRDLLTRRLGLEFGVSWLGEDDEGEYAPVVVET